MKAGFRFRTILRLTVFFVLLVSAWGMNALQPVAHTPPNAMTVQSEPKPREIAMRSLSAYRIKPAEILQIELLKMVPLPPYQVGAYEVLTIEVPGALADHPINNYFFVESEGMVNLGPAYGEVHIVGMTIPEVKVAIERHLRKYVRQPKASVEIARASGVVPITGNYIVNPDGTVDLRQYGEVHVAGMTIAEAKAAIDKHLSQFFDSPEASVNVRRARASASSRRGNVS